MKHWKYGLLPAVFCLCRMALGATAAIDSNVYLDDIKFLASKEMRGRATGSPELEKAGAFIAGKFREFGLKPANGKNFYQAFQVTTNARLGKTNRFRFTEGSRNVTLHVPEDFVPFNFSSSGKLSGEVAFVGYGITAPEYNYDDYAGIDVKGKIVVMLRHEPQEYDEKSVFAGKSYTRHTQFSSKASNAKNHGAVGVILINDIANHRSDPDQLEQFGSTDGPAEAGIPFIQVKVEKIKNWFKDAGKDLDAIQAEIDRTLQPQSFSFAASLHVDANLDIEREVKTVHNVVGYLPGETDEYVIIGAHYDHLGLGEQFALDPEAKGTVHPGADDNASGTSGVIELARWYSTQPKQKRGIVFMTFAGEELGLLGSEYYTEHPDFPLQKCAAMINMDMIGRVRNEKLYIGGVATGTIFRSLLESEAPKFALHLDYSDTAGYGSSDHAEFTAKGVPVLFFFSGLHGDYHKATDTWDKINAPEAAKVLELVADVTDQLREESGRPQYVRVAPPSGAGGPATGGSGGYGPYFGSVPDFGEGVKGVKFSDITPGSPAAIAGLKANDIMVEFDGKPIQNLYDFTYALQAKKPGDTVKVKALRNGTPIEVSVTLTRRR